MLTLPVRKGRGERKGKEKKNRKNFVSTLNIKAINRKINADVTKKNKKVMFLPVSKSK